MWTASRSFISHFSRATSPHQYVIPHRSGQEASFLPRKITSDRSVHLNITPGFIKSEWNARISEYKCGEYWVTPRVQKQIVLCSKAPRLREQPGAPCPEIASLRYGCVQVCLRPTCAQPFASFKTSWNSFRRFAFSNDQLKWHAYRSFLQVRSTARTGDVCGASRRSPAVITRRVIDAPISWRIVWLRDGQDRRDESFTHGWGVNFCD